MFPIPSLITVIKYGFISMVVTSAGFLIGNVIVMKHHLAEPLDDLVYKPRTSRQLEDTASGLEREYSKCFTQPTKTSCLRHGNEPFRAAEGVDQREKEDDVLLSEDVIRRNPMHMLLLEFSEYLSSLGIQAVVLEPSMLYCALSSENKYNLLIKEFNPHEFQGSLRTLTVGIFEDDAKILDAAIWENHLNGTSKTSFEAFRTRRWLVDAQRGEHAMYSVHFLFAWGSLKVHGLVLFARNGYLWHSGTDLPYRDLLFTNEGTYENFTTVPLVIKNDQSLDLRLPMSPAQFLFQIPNAAFLNCQPPEDEVKIFPHPSLTADQLVNRAVIAIQELKAVFQRLFVNFWLWTESLRGWFSACNIFHETYELNIAVLHSSVKRLNLTEIWAHNTYLELIESYTEEKDAGFSLGCHGLRINIFICHEEGDIVWYQHKTEEDVFSKRRIPFKLRLCSSDVLGQRVYVPCETKQIVTEQTNHLETPATTNTLDFY